MSAARTSLPYNPTHYNITQYSGCFRRLHNTGYVGCSSRTMEGDSGNLLYFASLQDVQWFQNVALQYDFVSNHHYIAVLPPSAFIPDILQLLNTTTNIAQQRASDLKIAGIVTYLDENHNGIGLRPQLANFGPPSPQNDIFPVDTPQYDYIWNPHGSSLIDKTFAFPMAVVAQESAVNLATKAQVNMELLRNVVSQHTNHTASPDQNDDLNNQSFSLNPIDSDFIDFFHTYVLPNTTHLPHQASLSFYNGAMRNSSWCLSQRTCSPVGGVNVLGTLASPQYLPNQPWLLVPVPYLGRGLFQRTAFNQRHVAAGLLVSLATSKTLSRYYNASLGDENNPGALPAKIVFALTVAEDFSAVGTRSLLDKLWKLYPQQNAKVGVFNDSSQSQVTVSLHYANESAHIVDPTATIAKQFVCHRAASENRVTHMPLSPVTSGINPSCSEPFYMTNEAFYSLRLDNLAGVFQFDQPTSSNMYMYSGSFSNSTTAEQAYMDLFAQLAKNITILDQNNVLHASPADTLQVPGLPPSSFRSFYHNISHTPLLIWNSSSLSDFDNELPAITTFRPPGLYISPTNTVNTHEPMMFSHFDDETQLAPDSPGNASLPQRDDASAITLLCAQSTLWTRFLLLASGSRTINGLPFSQSSQMEDLSGIHAAVNDISVNCTLVEAIYNCFTYGFQCDVFSASSLVASPKMWYPDPETTTQSLSEAVSTAETYHPQRVKSDPEHTPLNLPSLIDSLYIPTLVENISGQALLWRSWFTNTGYWAAYLSNEATYNQTSVSTSEDEITSISHGIATSTSVNTTNGRWSRVRQDIAQQQLHPIAKGIQTTQKAIQSLLPTSTREFCQNAVDQLQSWVVSVLTPKPNTSSPVQTHNSDQEEPALHLPSKLLSQLAETSNSSLIHTQLSSQLPSHQSITAPSSTNKALMKYLERSRFSLLDDAFDPRVGIDYISNVFTLGWNSSMFSIDGDDEYTPLPPDSLRIPILSFNISANDNDTVLDWDGDIPIFTQLQLQWSNPHIWTEAWWSSNKGVLTWSISSPEQGFWWFIIAIVIMVTTGIVSYCFLDRFFDARDDRSGL